MINRRTFLKNTAGAGALLAFGDTSLAAILDGPDFARVSILHTNDVHSRIEPFPMDGSRNQGLGGAARRAWMISELRQKHEHVLLLDSGDMLQGTPYFNVFGGELEFKLMSKMGYDAATMGNHDFDGGLEPLAQHLKYANFPLLVANYDFTGTAMEGKTKEYAVFERAGIRIGVFGLGIELDGLVPKALYGDTVYANPVPVGNRIAATLRNDLRCDYIICLSHLGYKYENTKVSDHVLARETAEIDLILGGHTHTFLKKPDVVANKAGKPVMITQAGWAGILLGHVELVFERNRQARCVSCRNLLIS
jgi:5'-nucleotidase